MAIAKNDMIFVNEITGDVVKIKSGKRFKLPPEYKPLEFVKNADGVPVARFRIRSPDGKGYATVDISENEFDEVAYGNAVAK